MTIKSHQHIKRQDYHSVNLVTKADREPFIALSHKFMVTQDKVCLQSIYFRVIF